ncbi:MAG: hypothetical protein U1D67_09645 [Dehalococcoidia bacterium]|nr:hypothetical protein [Dehalococcoidia bacterium]
MFKARANTRSTDLVITIRKNGADTALTVTITPGSTAVFLDTAHRVAVARGDLINFVAVGSGGTGAVTGFTFSVELE